LTLADRAAWEPSAKAPSNERLKPRVAIDIAAAVTSIVRSRPVQSEFVHRPCISALDQYSFDDGCIVVRGLPPNMPEDFIYRSTTNLSATNLAGFFLYPRANLSGAALNNSNLERASLHECQLIGIWLVGARLVRADLENARLNLANLNGANFEGANLRGADLRRASLRNTILRGADLTGTQLRGVDLTTAVGLSKMQLSGAVTDQVTKLPEYIH
jgi:hypothetical protein